MTPRDRWRRLTAYARAGAAYRIGCHVTLERERHAWDRLPADAQAWLVRP